MSDRWLGVAFGWIERPGASLRDAVVHALGGRGFGPTPAEYDASGTYLQGHSQRDSRGGEWVFFVELAESLLSVARTVAQASGRELTAHEVDVSDKLFRRDGETKYPFRSRSVVIAPDGSMRETESSLDELEGEACMGDSYETGEWLLDYAVFGQAEPKEARELDLYRAATVALSPRLASLVSQISVAGAFTVEKQGDLLRVRIESPDGKRIAVVSDAELAALIEATGVQPR